MAVGLCSGFAKDSSDPTVAETWEIKLAREAAFPRYLLEMGIGERSIEGAEAGREKDKNRILNLLCNVEGKKLRGEPPSSDHPAYKHANELLQGYLASMILPSVLLSSDAVFRSRVLEAVKTGHVRSLSLTVVPLTLEGRGPGFLPRGEGGTLWYAAGRVHTTANPRHRRLRRARSCCR